MSEPKQVIYSNPLKLAQTSHTALPPRTVMRTVSHLRSPSRPMQWANGKARFAQMHTDPYALALTHPSIACASAWLPHNTPHYA